MAKLVVQPGIHRPMVQVRCPKSGGIVWANPSKSGPRCTTCGGTGHDKA